MWGKMNAQLLRAGPSDSRCGWNKREQSQDGGILPWRNHQQKREFGRRAQFSEDSLTVILEMLQRCGKCCFYFPAWQYRKTN